MPHTSIPAEYIDLGRMDYGEAFAMQKSIQEQQIAGERGAVVLFVEHNPVITIGRRGNQDEIVAPRKILERRGIAIHETDRGGQVTYHGPGQIVAYPLVNLHEIDKGIHEYMRALEEAVIQTIAAYGLEGYRIGERTGVWVGRDKICAMGIRARKWWTLHGLALNVTTDLNHFGMIVPCGIRDRGVSSLEKILGGKCPSYDDVKAELKAQLAKQLELEYK